jgi:endonuclease YncB( thermonuclease family)
MRPFRTFRDAATFLVVLTVVLFFMQRYGVIDLGTGPVQVIDGDSLRNGETDIRLYGIDAPEYRQTCRDGTRAEYPCGKQAANALRELVGRKAVSCSSIDTDRYGRAVSVCKIDTLELNAEMVRLGWAVAYQRHSLNYVKLEAQARRDKRGLWSGTFEEPEAYRARNRSVHGDLSETVSAGGD